MSTWPALHPLGLITYVTFSSVTADLQHGKGGSLPSLGPHCTPPRGPCSPVQAIWIQFYLFVSPSRWGDWGLGGQGLSPHREKLVSMKSASTPACHTEPAQPRPQWPLWGGAADAPLTCPPLPRTFGVNGHRPCPASRGDGTESFSRQWTFLALPLSRFLPSPLYQDTFLKNCSSLSCAPQIQVFEINQSPKHLFSH